MSAPQIEGIVGARHGKGELVVISGPAGSGKSERLQQLLKKLPAGSRFSRLEWPYRCHAVDIMRDLRDGLFVFVETQESNLNCFPVKPYRLISLSRPRRTPA
ncbi:MAG: hypothetical protein Q8M53_10835 [Burkholderiales bacterium]|nr:hypothetical protein [Burkholderiales bacterium]